MSCERVRTGVIKCTVRKKDGAEEYKEYPLTSSSEDPIPQEALDKIKEIKQKAEKAGETVIKAIASWQ